MLRRLLGDLPFWLRRDQSAMRQETARWQPTRSRRQIIKRLLLTFVGLALLLLFSYLAATYGMMSAPFPLEATWRTLWAASLVLQALAVLPAVLTVRDTTRDSALRATPYGIGLWVRARWIGGLLRARVLLWIILLLRLAMIALLLIELTAMRGTYLDLLVTLQAKPSLPLPVAYGLIALGLTVALLLPVLSLAFDSMIGLLASTTLRERTFALAYQIGWVVMRWGSLVASVWLYDRVMNGEIFISTEAEPILYGSAVLLGDMGATLTHIARMSAAWERIPNSLWLPVGGVLLLLAYALLIEVGLWTVRRRVERAD